MDHSRPDPDPARQAPEPADIVVAVHGRTDVGRAREHNEDAFVVARLGTLEPLETLPASLTFDREGNAGAGALLMVADGMGGAAAGEVASAMAITAVLDESRARQLGDAADGEALATALRDAVEAANTRIHAHAADHAAHRGMGTTATVVVVRGDTLYAAQVGDSRAYLVRGGMAWQITKDQSLIQKLIDDGELTVEEAERSERRNIILQALGPEAVVRVDVTRQPLRRGDTLIVCTDGLSGLVSPTELADAAVESPTLGALCDRLIDAANDAGGFDNITVVAARFDGAALEDPTAEDLVGYSPVDGVSVPLWRATPAAALARLLTPGMGVPAWRRGDKEPPPVHRDPIVAYTLLAVALVVAVVLAVIRLV